MYLVRQLTGASLQEIGRQFGGGHHTTVLHSINKIEQMCCLDKVLNHVIVEFLGSLSNTANNPALGQKRNRGAARQGQSCFTPRSIG